MPSAKRIILVAAIVLAFSIGYWVARPRWPKANSEDVDTWFRRFCNIANTTRAYILSHEGELPGDLYRAMVDSNGGDPRITEYVRLHIAAGRRNWGPELYTAVMESNRVYTFGELVFFGNRVPEYCIDDVPVRLNVDLSKNAKGRLFWLDYADIHERWEFYTDGTVSRVGRGVSPSRPSVPQMQWRMKCESAGYPIWGTAEIKDEWYRQNKDKLVWDEGKGLYIVAKQPTSQPVVPARTP